MAVTGSAAEPGPSAPGLERGPPQRGMEDTHDKAKLYRSPPSVGSLENTAPAAKKQVTDLRDLIEGDAPQPGCGAAQPSTDRAAEASKKLDLGILAGLDAELCLKPRIAELE